MQRGDLPGFAALRAVGFVPLAPVSGTAVFLPALSYDACWNRFRLHPTPDDTAEQFERDARRTAMERMRRACVEAGGHGVFGATLTVRPFLRDSLEYVVSGTAVRADDAAPPRRGPFTAGVGAADLAKLLRAGWMPTALLLGVAVRALHDVTSDRQRASMNNVELTATTKLVQAARVAVRSAVTAEARRAGADTVLLGDAELTVADQPCTLDVTLRTGDGRRGREPVDGDGNEIEAEDVIVRAAMTGTALARLRRPIGIPAAPPLAMMRLDRDRPATNWRNAP